MAPFGGFSFAGQGTGLGDLTELLVMEGGKLKHGGSVHTHLLVESSKWFEQQIAAIKDAGRPDSKVQISLHYSVDAVRIFVDYLYSKERVPLPETFGRHGIEAFQLARFVQSPGFQTFCERILDYNIKNGLNKPTILHLQSARRGDLSEEVQNKIRDNIVERILAGTYEYSDDKNLIESSTQETVDAAVAQKMQTSGNVGAASEPSVGAAGFSFHKHDNHGGGSFANTDDPKCRTGGLFGAGASLSDDGHKYIQSSGGLFEQPSLNAGGLFGNTHNQQQASGGFFTPSAGLFGNNSNQTEPSNSLFARPAQNTGGLFGNTYTQTTNTSGSLFGNASQSGGLFGNHQTQTRNPGSLFGCNTNGSGSLFGANNQQQTQPSGGLFGQSTVGGSLFGNNNGASSNTQGFGSNTGGFGNNTGGFGSIPGGFGSNTGGFGRSNQFGNNTGFGSHTCGFGNNNSAFGGGFNNIATGTGFTTNTGSICTKIVNPADHVPAWPKPKSCSCGGNGGTPVLPDKVYLLEKEANGTNSRYLHISFEVGNQHLSPEELRLFDYSSGRKIATTTIQNAGTPNWNKVNLPHTELGALQAQVTKLEKEVKILTDKVQEFEHRETAPADEVDKHKGEKATAIDIETIVANHVAAHMTTMKQYISMPTDIGRAETHIEHTSSEQHLTKPLFACYTPLVIRDRNFTQEAQHTDLVNGESGASTPAIILTPTSSTASTPTASHIDKLTTIEAEDFVNIDAATQATVPNQSTQPNDECNDRHTLEEKVWSKVPNLSPTTRRVFAYLWAKPTSNHLSFVDEELLMDRNGFTKGAIEEAMEELREAEIMHYKTENNAYAPRVYIWGPKET